MSKYSKQVLAKKKLDLAPSRPLFNVEYFHIYTDEVISSRHSKSLDYLREAEKTWSNHYERIVLIDNYNPAEQSLTSAEVFKYLEEQDLLPDYWAFEGDLVENAKILLGKVNDRRLKQSYLRYVSKTKKYPCSLLTATWYLTRLNYLDSQGIIKALKGDEYKSPKTLMNILPKDYKPIEEKARRIILKSDFYEAADKIQDLFYSAEAGRALDLF